MSVLAVDVGSALVDGLREVVGIQAAYFDIFGFVFFIPHNLHLHRGTRFDKAHHVGEIGRRGNIPAVESDDHVTAAGQPLVERRDRAGCLGEHHRRGERGATHAL